MSETPTRRTALDVSTGISIIKGGITAQDHAWLVGKRDTDTRYKGFCYRYADGVLTRRPVRDITFTRDINPRQGGFSIEGRLWFVNDQSNSLEFYIQISGYTSPNTSFDISLGEGSWQGGVSVGRWAWVIEDAGKNAIGYEYVNNVLTRNSSIDRSLPASKSWVGAFSFLNRVFFINDTDDEATAFDVGENGVLTPNSDAGSGIDLDSKVWSGGFSIRKYAWLVNDTDNTLQVFEDSRSTEYQNSSNIHVISGAAVFRDSSQALGDPPGPFTLYPGHIALLGNTSGQPETGATQMPDQWFASTDIPAYLRHFQIRRTTGINDARGSRDYRLRISKFLDASTAGSGDVGPHLLDDVRQNIEIKFENGDDVYVRTGISDSSEPYEDSFSGGHAFSLWVNRISEGDFLKITLRYPLTTPLEVRGSLVGPAARINGRLLLEDNTLEITGSLVGPVARVAGRLETGIPGGFVVTFPHDEFSSIITYAIWDNSVAQPGPGDWFEDATLTAAHRSVDRFLITTAGLVQVNFGTGDIQALKTSILSRIEIGLTLTDGSTLTLHGIRDGDETDPYSWTPPNASAANAYRAKVMTLSDRTLVARFTLTDVPPLEITGSLTGPVAQVNGRLTLGADTPVEITGSLVGPAARISGRVTLGADAPLEITGSLVGPAAQINGRLALGTDTTLEITGSLVGPVAQINGRLALGDIALPFGTDAINLPAGTKTLDWIVLAVLRATINGADITVDPVSPRQGELVVADDLTIDGVERHSSPFPLIRLRKDGSADFSTYFDNEGSPRYPRAKLFIQTTAAGPAIPFTISSTGGGFNNWNIDAGYDRTAITAIQTGDFFILAIAETPTPLTITGALTGPAAQINGRLAFGADTLLTITGALTGPAAQINGRLVLGTDALLEITGSLVGPAAQINGRLVTTTDHSS